jgi:hypothetical protein
MFTTHLDILQAIGVALGQRWAYYWHGAHHFPLDVEGDWTLAVYAESAGRIRFEACHLGRTRGTKWGLEGRIDRAVAVALEARDEVLAEV